MNIKLGELRYKCDELKDNSTGTKKEVHMRLFDHIIEKEKPQKSKGEEDGARRKKKWCWYK